MVQVDTSTHREDAEIMFEYICDRVIPGCSTKETGDTPEAVREKAIAHLHDHHGTEYLEDRPPDTVNAAIFKVTM